MRFRGRADRPITWRRRPRSWLRSKLAVDRFARVEGEQGFFLSFSFLFFFFLCSSGASGLEILLDWKLRRETKKNEG